jgi:hypothetical protein
MSDLEAGYVALVMLVVIVGGGIGIGELVHRWIWR